MNILKKVEEMVCKFIFGIMLAFTTCTPAYSADLKYFGFEAAKIYNERQSYITPYTLLGQQGKQEVWDYQTSVLFNVVPFKINTKHYFYWDNEVYGKATTAQYRQVGWKSEVGFRLNTVDVFWNHHSKHWLENRSVDRYPLHDRYGLRFNFYGER